MGISPIDDVVEVSLPEDKFTVGAYAMDVGGGLKIGTRRQSDFGHPQFNNPEADNYTTVSVQGRKQGLKLISTHGDTSDPLMLFR